MTDTCAIIIPAIKFNVDLRRCIKFCLKQEKVKIKIYVVLDSIVGNLEAKKEFNQVNFLSFGSINMSEKRNEAVKFCNEKYVAFIDSDAYPSQKWLLNGIDYLKNKKKVGLVSGPDLPFPNESGWKRIIGISHKSFLLSGSKTFRKNIKEELFCNHVSSCNMIMQKKLYLKVGGMNKNIYIGEDIEFCNKVAKIKKIAYIPSALIFHQSRNLVSFFKQRFTYGFSTKYVIKNKLKSNFEFLVPLLFVTFLLSFPLILFFELYKYIFQSLIFALLLFLFYESLKISKNIFDCFKIVFIFLSSLIIFGLGSLYSFSSVNSNIKKIYTSHINN